MTTDEIEKQKPKNPFPIKKQFIFTRRMIFAAWMIFPGIKLDSQRIHFFRYKKPQVFYI